MVSIVFHAYTLDRSRLRDIYAKDVHLHACDQIALARGLWSSCSVSNLSKLFSDLYTIQTYASTISVTLPLAEGIEIEERAHSHTMRDAVRADMLSLLHNASRRSCYVKRNHLRLANCLYISWDARYLPSSGRAYLLFHHRRCFIR